MPAIQILPCRGDPVSFCLTCGNEPSFIYLFCSSPTLSFFLFYTPRNYCYTTLYFLMKHSSYLTRSWRWTAAFLRLVAWPCRVWIYNSAGHFCQDLCVWKIYDYVFHYYNYITTLTYKIKCLILIQNLTSLCDPGWSCYILFHVNEPKGFCKVWFLKTMTDLNNPGFYPKISCSEIVICLQSSSTEFSKHLL